MLNILGEHFVNMSIIWFIWTRKCSSFYFFFFSFRRIIQQLQCWGFTLCIVFQLEEDQLRGVPLLVFANKQDLPRAMSVSDITEALCLSGLSRPVRFYSVHIIEAPTTQLVLLGLVQSASDLIYSPSRFNLGGSFYSLSSHKAQEPLVGSV